MIRALLLPIVASAQSILTSNSLCNNVASGRFDAGCVKVFMVETIGLVFNFVGAICLIMIIIAGYQIALAKAIGRDRSEGLTRLRVAVVGFILSVCTWYIIDFIISALTLVPPN